MRRSRRHAIRLSCLPGEQSLGYSSVQYGSATGNLDENLQGGRRRRTVTNQSFSTNRVRIRAYFQRVIVELNTGPEAPKGKVSLCSSMRPAKATSSRVGKCRNKNLASRLTRSGRELSRLSSTKKSRVCTTARERSSGIVIFYLHKGGMHRCCGLQPQVHRSLAGIPPDVFILRRCTWLARPNRQMTEQAQLMFLENTAADFS